MCGINLLTDFDASDTDKHRGIQTDSTYIAGIGMHAIHHRLPIQTLAEDEWMQPITLHDDVVLMYNGELFNYDKNKYSCDIAYLSEFFDKYNSFEKICSVDCLMEMNTWDGFWSVVLINPNKKEVVAFTDPLGKKQLYINHIGEISSELKSLTYGREVFLDKIFLSTVRKWGYNTDNRTPYESIKRIMPNAIYKFEFNTIGVNPYNYRVCTPYFDFSKSIHESTPENFRNLIKKAVGDRLITKKYPIAMLLSGGLDSTTITHFLSEDFGSQVSYYSIQNDEDDEHVKIVRDYFDIDVKFLDYQMDDGNRELIYYMNDFPIDLGSVVPQWYLFEAIAKQTDCKIVLSGDGADELFGGYKRVDEYDSQGSDVFEELPFYHLPRLDRMSMAHTLELRSPFLNHDLVRFALNLSKMRRTHKSIIKEAMYNRIPDEVINRKKLPLKNPEIRKDKIKYRQKVLDEFIKSKNVY